MKYAFLIYENESVYNADKDHPAVRDITARHMAFAESLGSTRLGGAGLQNVRTATTVRGQDHATTAADRTIHDGPFAETKEQLGGFYLVDVPDLDAAIKLARQVPFRTAGGSIEIRPLLNYD